MTRIMHMAAAAVIAAGCGTAQAQSGAGDPARGAKVFENCISCHSPERSAADTVGPSLHGLFGRAAGSGDGFRYSPALRRSGIVWDEQSLDRFIADPQAAVPANRMPYSGVPDARDRADLIRYLQQAFR